MVTLAVSLVLAAGAVVAGFWQMGRHEVRADARDLQQVAVLEPPAPVAEVAPPGTTDAPDEALWRTVEATGTIDADSIRVLRNRPVDGNAAWHVLGWLDTTDGVSFLLDLGWIPQPAAEATAPDLTPPDGLIEVTAVMRAWEEPDGRDGGFSVTRITPGQLPTPQLPAVPGYGMVTEVCVGGDCNEALFGQSVPLPSLTTGPHLSYAWQWWVIAVMLPVGAILLLRRENQPDMADADPAATPATPRRPSRDPRPARVRPRRLSDEEIEDAL